MVGIDWCDKDLDLGSIGRGGEREGMGASHLQNPKQGEIEAGEFGGEEPGGNRGAEEGTAGPVGGEALGVVGVEVGEEVGLALLVPPINRDQTLLHFSLRLYLLFLP